MNMAQLTAILINGIALVLILEGILPFLSPVKWREMIQSFAKMSDKNIRVLGLGLFLLGAATFYVHNFVMA